MKNNIEFFIFFKLIYITNLRKLHIYIFTIYLQHVYTPSVIFNHISSFYMALKIIMLALKP